MRLQLEAVRDEIVDAAWTTVDIEVAITCGAVEVVVMLGGDRGKLVSIVPATDRDVHEIAGFLKTSNCSIDRS